MMGDPRTARTIDSMRRSFVLLMEQRHFERITVKDLCEVAGINRSTFYDHFDNIIEFRDDFLTYVAQGLTDAVSSNGANSKLLFEKNQAITCYTNWFSYIRDNRHVFNLLLGPTGTPEFSALILAQGIRWYLSLLAPVHVYFERDMPMETVANYIIGAHMGLMRSYLDPDDQRDPETMARRLVYLSYSGVLSLLRIPDLSVERPSDAE